MDLNPIFKFLILAEECESVSELADALEKLIRHYRFDYYGLIKQPKPDENPMNLSMMGRWPKDWPETYIAKKYVLIDPTIRYLGKAQTSFRWSDVMAEFKADPYKKRMERMMADAERFGLVDGYMFPVHGRTGLLGNLTLGGRPVELSSVEMTMFDAAAKKAFWRHMELTGVAGSLRAQANLETRLTRREMEILSYLADGLTSNEISKVLSISSHTVDWYMNGMQDKLNAKNRQQVVAIAFRLGLIT
ncbi:LuxR family transcriptional regulator [Agrobacterium sp. ES01]|uniref:LuxR family transcriptional regulator n=1 Tax=Agrobacterium sp. ES01 TaxID=3420714 RepID=UPI003D1517DE